MITERDLQIAYFAGFHAGIIRASYHRDDTELEELIDEAMSDPENIYGFLTTFYNAWYCKNDKKGECLSPDDVVDEWQQRRANKAMQKSGADVRYSQGTESIG